jgi:hypothetical protein
MSKVVALWGAPRCVSTAFEKTFSQRPDTEILHEPFSFVYYFSQWRRSDRFGDYKEKYSYSSDEVIKDIKSRVAPVVFFKDLAFQALPYINEEFKDFIDSITNTFIVRHPHEVLASWYKVEGGVSEEEFGFIALDRAWSIITEELGKEAIVVEANRFRRNPKQILTDYCQRIQIEFDPRMLSWEDGKVQQWNNREAEYHAPWHKTLDNSTGIIPPSENCQVNIHPEDVDMVERAVKVYQKLSHYAL